MTPPPYADHDYKRTKILSSQREQAQGDKVNEKCTSCVGESEAFAERSLEGVMKDLAWIASSHSLLAMTYEARAAGPFASPIAEPMLSCTPCNDVLEAKVAIRGKPPPSISRDKNASRYFLQAKIYIFPSSISPPLMAIEPEWSTAKECRMFEKFIKSCVKFSICSAALFFVYHLFITQKLEEEVPTNVKEQE